MMHRKVQLLLFWSCCLVLAPLASAQQAREWLQRMNQALVSSNYDGIFSHWRDGRVETLRIVHRIQDGEVTERLASLDGSGREFIRSGMELMCYLPDKRMVVVEQRSERQPLFGNFPSFDNSANAIYDIAEVKRTRINRRYTRLIEVSPRDDYRYGYRLWIDEGTALPIKTQLCDPNGRVIEQIIFSDLKRPARIADAEFKPDVVTEGFRWIRNERRPEGFARAQQVILWNALKLPPGFRMLKRSAQHVQGAAAPVAHLVFSDGLASVSVFVESRDSAALPSAAKLSSAMKMGSSSAFSTMIDGHKVTAVGEVPPATVQFIANALRADRTR
jgi:sigma-E factor negative regulatory protein RseB